MIFLDYLCPPFKATGYRGRVARLSSAKAATAVRIRSIPPGKNPADHPAGFLMKNFRRAGQPDGNVLR